MNLIKSFHIHGIFAGIAFMVASSACGMMTVPSTEEMLSVKELMKGISARDLARAKALATDIADVGESVALWPVSIFVPLHELGHAIAGLLLKGDPMDLRLGKKDQYGQPRFVFQNKWLSIALYSLRLASSAAYMPTSSYRGNKIKESILLAAGPLAGLMALWAMNKALNAWAQYQIKQKESRMLAPAFTVPIKEKQSYKLSFLMVYKMMIYAFAIEQIFQGFTPIGGPSDSDGSRLWRLAGASGKQVKMLNKLEMFKAISMSFGSMLWLYHYLNKNIMIRSR